MKVLRHRNLFGLLFAALLALPLINIAVRCIYVQSNKNAKDSYSNPVISYYEYKTNEVNNVNDLINGNIYHLELLNFTPTNEDVILTCNALYNSSFTNLNTNTYSSYQGISISHGVVAVYNTYTGTRYDGLRSIQNATITLYLDFVYVTSTNVEDIISYISPSTYLGELIETQDNTLDNAFEYSVHQVIDNDLGKINFFTWFEDMFFDGNSSTTNLYIHFANWYMNYALLISLVYILFLVLMWFVNFVRKLLDRGMSFGEGSY